MMWKKQQYFNSCFSKKSGNVSVNMNNCYATFLHVRIPLFLLSNKYIKITTSWDIYDENHDLKQLGEWRFISVTLPHYNLTWKEFNVGAAGRNRKAGTEADTMKKSYVLACSPGLAKPLFL